MTVDFDNPQSHIPVDLFTCCMVLLLFMRIRWNQNKAGVHKSQAPGHARN